MFKKGFALGELLTLPGVQSLATRSSNHFSEMIRYHSIKEAIDAGQSVGIVCLEFTNEEIYGRIKNRSF